MRKIIEQCPACSGELIITQLSCSQCSTVINGHFRATRFARLTAPELAFLEVFVKNRGNVKEMERELGDSYWSIKAVYRTNNPSYFPHASYFAGLIHW